MKTVRRRTANRGETLVEVIVSFVIVTMTLVMITAIVQLGIGLNNRATEKATLLENATTAAENGTGTPSGNVTGMTLTLTPKDTTQSPLSAVQNIRFYVSDPLWWFAPSGG